MNTRHLIIALGLALALMTLQGCASPTQSVFVSRIREKSTERKPITPDRTRLAKRSEAGVVRIIGLPCSHSTAGSRYRDKPVERDARQRTPCLGRKPRGRRCSLAHVDGQRLLRFAATFPTCGVLQRACKACPSADTLKTLSTSHSWTSMQLSTQWKTISVFDSYKQEPAALYRISKQLLMSATVRFL